MLTLGLLGEREEGDGREAQRKSQRRDKELPRRKERRRRKAPKGLWGGHLGDYGRGRDLKEKTKLAKTRGEEQICIGQFISRTCGIEMAIPHSVCTRMRSEKAWYAVQAGSIFSSTQTPDMFGIH